jgi:hypothetical protein
MTPETVDHLMQPVRGGMRKNITDYTAQKACLLQCDSQKVTNSSVWILIKFDIEKFY